MSAALRLRPHHLLCVLGFQGKGYSDDFTDNMAAIVDALRRSGGADCMIEIVTTADAICAPCPHRRGVSCSKAAQIAGLDARHAAALGLKNGDRLTWGAAQARIRRHVAPDALANLCAGCQWLELGLCARGLAQLHETQEADPKARP